MDFTPIGIEDFLRMYKENNPQEDISDFGKSLVAAVNAKRAGETCIQCGKPIWAVGAAVVGWSACFDCISEVAEIENNYEIDSVCNVF